MIKLSDVEWQEFNIIDIFSIEKGSRIKQQDRINGNTMLKTAGEYNMGYKDKIYSEKNKLFFQPSITIDMFGNVFASNEKFYADDNVHILNNEKLNLNNCLFIAAILKILKNKYSYSRQVRIDKLKKEKILLPIDNENNKPNWEFMEQYIRERAKNIIFKPKINIKYDNNLKLNFVKWEEFKIKDLFLIKRGKRLKSVDRRSGQINYYSTSNFNNGLTDKISNPLFIEKNALIFTTFGYCYYVDNNFTASDEVNILQIQNMELNKEIALFLVSILNQIKYKYSFGRKAFMNRLINETISLPTNENNKPNWEFMEQYIKERTKNIYL